MIATDLFDHTSPTDPCDSVIEARGLTRYFGRRCAVDSVSFSVPRGSVFAFIGRNGAGKTTTIRMLLGLLEPTRGSSIILGCDSATLPPEARARIGYMAEGHPVYGWMRVGEYRAISTRLLPSLEPRNLRRRDRLLRDQPAHQGRPPVARPARRPPPGDDAGDRAGGADARRPGHRPGPRRPQVLARGHDLLHPQPRAHDLLLDPPPG